MLKHLFQWHVRECLCPSARPSFDQTLDSHPLRFLRNVSTSLAFFRWLKETEKGSAITCVSFTMLLRLSYWLYRVLLAHIFAQAIWGSHWYWILIVAIPKQRKNIVRSYDIDECIKMFITRCSVQTSREGLAANILNPVTKGTAGKSSSPEHRRGVNSVVN